MLFYNPISHHCIIPICFQVPLICATNCTEMLSLLLEYKMNRSMVKAVSIFHEKYLLCTVGDMNCAI